MPGPWERFQPQAAGKPWERFAKPAVSPGAEESDSIKGKMQLAMSPAGSGLEALLALGSGGIAGNIAGGLAGLAGTALPGAPGQGERWLNATRDALTYRPRSPGGREALALLSKPMELLDRVATEIAAPSVLPPAPPSNYRPMGEAAAADQDRYSAMQNMTPLESAATKTALLGLPMLFGPKGAPRAVPEFGETSVGAAASSASPQMAAIAGASPLLQKAVARASARGRVNPDVLSRRLDAETLPIPQKLTKGQATRDPVDLSNEQNMRAKNPELANTFNQQHQGIVDNLSAIRDQAGPDVFSTNAVEHGDALIRAYLTKDQEATAAINQAYKAARDANGGDLPMDGKGFVTAADSALKQAMKGRYVPKEIAADLADIRESGAMNFETFENLRTNLAAESRKAERAGDGNAAGAIRIVRDALENIQPKGRAVDVKPLFDKARKLSRTRFEALEADPAYKAAVNESIPPDRFVHRFIVSAPRDQVSVMRSNLAHDPQAVQTMGVSTIDYLREQSGLDALGNGKFSQARYNKRLEALSPKLGDLFEPKSAQTLQQLGRYARYIQEQPAGSFVNNSNTLTAALGKGVAGSLEGVANVAAHGVPVGTFGRYLIQRGMSARQAKKALEPGAGLDYPH